MNPRNRLPKLFFCICLLFAMAGPGPAEIVRRGSSALTHGPETVAVTGQALVHTAQLLPMSSAGKIAGGDAAAQARQVLDNVQAALDASGTQLAAVVKLNLYVRPAIAIEPVLEAVKQCFPGGARPAISLVETALPRRDALVAADAVAARPATPQDSAVGLYHSAAIGNDSPGAHASLLPAGQRAYISGQAVREGDLQTATSAVLHLLRQNLEFLGLGLSDTVQVKTFLRPMSSAPAVAATIREFFGKETPPLVFVEWSNPEPIEIELIAAGSRSASSSAEPLEYLTPPGERASPVFCRIVRVSHPTTIYFSGVYGQGGDSPGQIHSAFDRLGSAARGAGTDLRHLVKATYYVTTDEIGQQLTDIRRGLYDPRRPPAASKATVAGTGAAESVFTMDMIAVPAPTTGTH